MPKNYQISPDQLEAIQKSILSAVSSDQAVVEAVAKNFEALAADLVEVPDVEDDVTKGLDDTTELQADPVADIFLGLHEAVAQISKSKAPNSDELIKKAFEAAFAEANAVADQIAEASFAAGAGAGQPVNKRGKPKDNKDDMDNQDDPGEDSEDDMEKALAKALRGTPGPVGTLLVALNKRNQTLETSLNKLLDERATDLAKRNAVAIGEPETFADVLKQLEKADPTGKLGQTITKMIEGKNKAIQKGALFGELGGGGAPTTGGTTALDQLNGFAAEIQKAAGGAAKMTFAKAFLEAARQHQDVYLEHRRHG